MFGISLYFLHFFKVLFTHSRWPHLSDYVLKLFTTINIKNQKIYIFSSLLNGGFGITKPKGIPSQIQVLQAIVKAIMCKSSIAIKIMLFFIN